MTDINDLLTLSISIDLKAVEDNQRSYSECYEEGFSVRAAEADMTASKLREMADAIEAGTLYGWMSQEMVDAKCKAGDLRGETPEEASARLLKKEEHHCGADPIAVAGLEDTLANDRASFQQQVEDAIR